MAHLASHVWNKPETADCTLVVPLDRSRVSLRLHRQCLSEKSPFLRGLLDGASPIHLLQSLSASRAAPLRVPHSQLPRLLPSPPSHPVLFLPVPDPLSIQQLIHWMYFDNTDLIEHALDRGHIHWEGLARNVEYLGLSTDIKVFLGRWYRSWYLPSSSSSSSDSDEMSDSDSDEYYDLPSDSDEEESASEQVCERGRTRDIKPLIKLCGQLRICTA